jgi:hypothetical protein
MHFREAKISNYISHDNLMMKIKLGNTDYMPGQFAVCHVSLFLQVEGNLL